MQPAGESCSIFERYNLHKSRFLVFVVFGIFAFLKYLSQYTVLGDFIIGIITVLPFILLIAFFAWIYFKDRENHVLYQTMQKCDVFLKMSFKLSAAILILFIVFFPSAWKPLFKFFDVFRQLFSLETYFLFASYAAVIIVACGLIIFSIRLYQIGRGTYQKTVNHLIKKSLYSTFFVLLFLLLISVVTYPQAYYPITDAVSDGIYTISQGSIALTKLSGEDLQKTDSLFGLARRAISQTSDNLSGEIDTTKTNLLTNISQSKNILAQSISETQTKLNEQISNRVSTEGGDITGDITLSGDNADLTIEGLTTTGDIVPSDNLTYDLGSTSNGWNNLYVHQLIGASPIILSDTLIPETTAINLGSASNHFGTIYADNLVGVEIASSQWTTAGDNIYYNLGSVGIGTSDPQAALSVEGSIITGQLSSNLITSGPLSAIIGGEINTVTGDNSVIIGGKRNIVDEENAFIFGGYNSKVYAWGSVSIGGDDNDINSCEESGIFAGYSNTIECTNISYDYGTVIIGGSRNIIDGGYSTIINGRFNEITGSYSTIIGGGGYANVSANKAIIIGSGVSSQDKLINDTESSLMIGFNSDVPTLFVGPSSGVGTVGSVGIGTTDPQAKLNVYNDGYGLGNGEYNNIRIGGNSGIDIEQNDPGDNLATALSVASNSGEGVATFNYTGDYSSPVLTINSNNATYDNNASLINANSYTITSNNLINLYQYSTAFSGNGIYMDFGGDSVYEGSFTGNFLNFYNEGSQMAYVDSTGGAYFAGDVSVQNNLLAQLEGGTYYGRTRVTENQWGVSDDRGVTWTARDSSRAWSGIAISSDGKFQTAVVTGGQIYTSSDYGASWTARDSSRDWFVIAMSSDGKYQTAGIYGGQIYTSTNYGVSWDVMDLDRIWNGISMSSDGKYQTAVVNGGSIYVSTDYGINWDGGGSDENWRGVAMSSDGKYQTAVASSGQIYTSIDYGATWTARDSNRSWNGIAMSSDGKYQTAVVLGGQIYISLNYGVTWAASDSNRNWYGVAMSSDGKYQTAVNAGGQIYTSTDYGATWTAEDSNRDWRRVAMSSDGKYQTATVYSGQIFTSYASSYTNGNVGIGTDNPSSSLEVSGGDIRVTGGSFIDDGTTLDVPDYVFEPGYAMLSINELQNYIGINKHLPGIPDMNDRTGWAALSLQDRDMKLLEKIEENILYTIDNSNQIAGITLKTDQNILTISDLQKSVDEQLGVIQESLALVSDKQDTATKQIKNLDEEITNQETKIKTLETLSATLQAQMTELQKSIATPVDVAQIDLNTQDIDLLKQTLGITDESNPGDISILGKFTAEKVVVDGIETGGITIKVSDEDAATIGEATILTGETAVVVETKAVTDSSKVFVTIKSKLTQEATLMVTDINDGENFKVELVDAAAEDVKFDWWIVEKK